MNFDISKTLTSVTKNRAIVGGEYYFSDELALFQEFFERGRRPLTGVYKGVLEKIEANTEYPFQNTGLGNRYRYVYPVENPTYEYKGFVDMRFHFIVTETGDTYSEACDKVKEKVRGFITEHLNLPRSVFDNDIYITNCDETKFSRELSYHIDSIPFRGDDEEADDDDDTKE